MLSDIGSVALLTAVQTAAVTSGNQFSVPSLQSLPSSCHPIQCLLSRHQYVTHSLYLHRHPRVQGATYAVIVNQCPQYFNHTFQKVREHKTNILRHGIIFCKNVFFLNFCLSLLAAGELGSPQQPRKLMCPEAKPATGTTTCQGH